MADPARHSDKETDLTDAWRDEIEDSFVMRRFVPRAVQPMVAGTFAVLSGAVAAFFFAAGMLVAGALFSVVVLVGVYLMVGHIRRTMTAKTHAKD